MHKEKNPRTFVAAQIGNVIMGSVEVVQDIGWIIEGGSQLFHKKVQPIISRRVKNTPGFAPVVEIGDIAKMKIVEGATLVVDKIYKIPPKANRLKSRRSSWPSLS